MTDLITRLRHAITTASNDDMSAPWTSERARHAERVNAMMDAVEALSWRSIETAPRDGTLILGCCRGPEKWSDVGFWHDGSQNYRQTAGWYEECYRGDLLTARPVQPTHWMPLPEPPHE
jgi:hypothetical protein